MTTQISKRQFRLATIVLLTLFVALSLGSVQIGGRSAFYFMMFVGYVIGGVWGISASVRRDFPLVGRCFLTAGFGSGFGGAVGNAIYYYEYHFEYPLADRIAIALTNGCLYGWLLGMLGGFLATMLLWYPSVLFIPWKYHVHPFQIDSGETVPFPCAWCGSPLPVWRRPSTFRQWAWGGYTCPKCKHELDRYGVPLDKSARAKINQRSAQMQATGSDSPLQCYQQMEPSHAIRELDEHILTNPRDAELYLERAALWLEFDEHERAIDDLTSAIELDPALVEARSCRAQIYRLIGRNAEAADDERVAFELRRDES